MYHGRFGKNWEELVLKLEENFEDELTLKPYFLIGVQELGQGIRDFDKEEKHICYTSLLVNY